MVCKPEEQKRFTVRPEVVTGQPAMRAIWRAMFMPVAPSGLAQPMMTSSTSEASMPARAMACCTAWPPSVAPWVMLKAPFQLLASGVRAVETITALVMCFSWFLRGLQPVNVLPSATRRCSSGAGCQNLASSCGFLAKRFMASHTLNRPTWSA